jgi:hypothetical protein
MQLVRIPLVYYGVPGIGAARVTDYQFGLLSQIINNLSLTFVAPLGPYYYYLHISLQTAVMFTEKDLFVNLILQTAGKKYPL